MKPRRRGTGETRAPRARRPQQPGPRVAPPLVNEVLRSTEPPLWHDDRGYHYIGIVGNKVRLPAWPH